MALVLSHQAVHSLLILFFNLALSKTKDGRSKFGHYEGYVALPYQVLGILTFVVLFLAGVIFPDVYATLDTHEEVPVGAQEENKNQIFLWNHWKMLKLDFKSGSFRGGGGSCKHFHLIKIYF